MVAHKIRAAVSGFENLNVKLKLNFHLKPCAQKDFFLHNSSLYLYGKSVAIIGQDLDSLTHSNPQQLWGSYFENIALQASNYFTLEAIGWSTAKRS